MKASDHAIWATLGLAWLNNISETQLNVQHNWGYLLLKEGIMVISGNHAQFFVGSTIIAPTKAYINPEQIYNDVAFA